MRTIFAGFVAAVLLAPLAARAADMAPMPYKAPMYPEPTYFSWTGFYIGLNGGYGFGTSDWTGLGLSPKGAVYGGQLGYNFQTGTWVWGLEGDFDLTNIKSSDTCIGGNCESKLPWLATARARIGFAALSNWMPYITGGAAFGNVKASSPLGDASETKVGWIAGGGLEYAFWSSWTIRAEYLYADLGSFDCGTVCGGDVSFKTSIVRGGLNYRF